MNDPMVQLLSLSRRAGKLLRGFDQVKEGIAQQQVCAVVLAQDLSPKTEKELRYVCRNLTVPFVAVPATMAQLEQYVGKKVGVMALTEAGFAQKLQALAQDSPQTRP